MNLLWIPRPNISSLAFAVRVHISLSRLAAPHYEAGFDIDKFVFIVVESGPPHGVAIYAVDSNMLLKGVEARKRNMDSYCECKAADVWPGYPERDQSIELPSWA